MEVSAHQRLMFHLEFNAGFFHPTPLFPVLGYCHFAIEETVHTTILDYLEWVEGVLVCEREKEETS